jgi:hypothetical protein
MPVGRRKDTLAETASSYTAAILVMGLVHDDQVASSEADLAQLLDRPQPFTGYHDRSISQAAISCRAARVHTLRRGTGAREARCRRRVPASHSAEFVRWKTRYQIRERDAGDAGPVPESPFASAIRRTAEREATSEPGRRRSLLGKAGRRSSLRGSPSAVPVMHAHRVHPSGSRHTRTLQSPPAC